MQTLAQLSQNLLDEIEHFFVSYNQAKGKEFKPLGRFGPERAEKIVIYNTGAGLKYLEAYSTRFPRTASGEQDKLGGLITPR